MYLVVRSDNNNQYFYKCPSSKLSRAYLMNGMSNKKRETTVWRPRQKKTEKTIEWRWSDQIRKDFMILGVRDRKQLLAMNKKVWKVILKETMGLQGL